MAKTVLSIAAILAALAVLFGAFGAHGLKATLSPDMMAVYQTAVQYHMWHSLGLAIVAYAALRWPGDRALQWSAAVMIVGIILFSGSLYALALTQIKIFGVITPFGGLAFIAAWLVFATAIRKAV